MPGAVVIEWINGAKLVVRHGDTGLTGNIYCGLHEFPEMAYLLHVLSADDLFVDVGANAGSYTVLACAAKGASGCSIEPVPANFERLIENIKLNGLCSRVDARSIGLASKTGTLAFTADHDCTSHVATTSDASARTVLVSVGTLDDVIRDRCPSLIKIDVEGFEAEVLAGATETLKKHSLHSIIIELNGSGRRYGVDDDEIVRLLKSCGFEACRYEPLSKNLETLSGKNTRSGNTLFVRGRSEVMKRIENACPIIVHGIAV